MPHSNFVSEKSNFFALPAELPNSVYEYILENSIAADIGTSGTHETNSAITTPPILQVCREARKEASRMYCHLLEETLRDLKLESKQAREHVTALMAERRGTYIVDGYGELIVQRSLKRKQRRHLRGKVERIRTTASDRST